MQPLVECNRPYLWIPRIARRQQHTLSLVVAVRAKKRISRAAAACPVVLLSLWSNCRANAAVARMNACNAGGHSHSSSRAVAALRPPHAAWSSSEVASASLATAGRLAKRGARVTVLEKNDKVGGRVGEYSWQQHRCRRPVRLCYYYGRTRTATR